MLRRILVATVLFVGLLFLPDAPSRALLHLQGAGLASYAPANTGCVLWQPSNAETPPIFVFDPSTFTYSGSNFTSGPNSGSGAGAWAVDHGVPVKGTPLNGFNVIGFAGSEGIVNTASPWSGGNVYVFAVASVPTTHFGALVSAAWDPVELRDNTHDWIFFPRAGNAFGGSVNESWLFQGTGAAVLTRGDLFTDASYHIAAIKMGTSVDLRLDGTVGTPSSTTGTINPATASTVRVGASGAAGQEALTGSVAYLVVLSNPTTTDIQNFEGWAAWRFGLQANLPGGHPDKTAPPCVGGSTPPGCTVSPCDPPALTWTQVQANAGTAATRPDTNWGHGGPNYPGTSRTPCALGVYPYAVPENFSWFCGGDSYLGDPLRWGNNGSYLGVAHTSACIQQLGVNCTSMTELHLVYVEATDITGTVAKSTVTGTNVWYRNRSSWCHSVSGGWTLMQHAQTGDPIVTGRFDAPQTGNDSSALTVTDHGGGVFSEPAPPFAPPPGWANHGWIQNRGVYSLNSIDGCFTYEEVRVDQPNDNHIFACGQDWWQSEAAPYPNNTGYSESSWIRLTVDWQSVVCSSLPLALLQADPPPPAVGIGP